MQEEAVWGQTPRKRKRGIKINDVLILRQARQDCGFYRFGDTATL
jgi:hypothetical protein